MNTIGAFLANYVHFYLSYMRIYILEIISSSAFASSSGQDVPLPRQSIPFNSEATSLAERPSARRQTP